jgi:ketosteroid isomerase-like protein
MVLRSRFVLSVLCLLALAACSRTSPEAALRENVAQIADAVRARDTSAVLKHLADDFVRDSGGVDKAEVRRMLTAAFLRNEKIALTATVREVKIDGAIATAKINVIATGGAGLIPERADGWEFTTAWRRSSNDWKLYNAQWQ